MKVSEQAQDSVKKLIADVESAKQRLNIFLSGLKLGLGIDGDCEFDPRTMEFKEKSDDEQSKNSN